MDVGTLFYTWLWGRQVGTDQFGNRYYEHKSKRVANGKLKRWILYKGLTEASKVPPKWHAWLHYNLEELPSVQVNTSANSVNGKAPNVASTTRASTALNSSMAGYCSEIGWLQFAQRPRRSRKLSTGMLCRALIGVRQWPQVERGCDRLMRGRAETATGWPRISAALARHSACIMRGKRRMTTLRKLPTIRPNRPTAAKQNNGCSANSACIQTTEPSLKMGRYMAITSPPTSTPIMAMIMGSSSDDSEST